MSLRGSPDRSIGVWGARRLDPLILLVEDDFVLRCSLAELLSEEAFRVECCADGDEALRRLQRPPPPALILLDIMLPRINGFELRALQRKNPMTADIPVIAISAHDLDPQHVDELDLGPTFRKPLDIDRLLTRIRSLTGHA